MTPVRWYVLRMIVAVNFVAVVSCLPGFPANKEIDPRVAARLLMDSKLYVFVTPGTHDGKFDSYGGVTYANGISGADAYCMQQYPLVSPALPVGIYKAMLVDGVNRTACVNASCSPANSGDARGWVFIPNATYYLPDQSVVFTTNAQSVISGSLQKAIDPSAAVRWWTGVDNLWTASVGCDTSWNVNLGGVHAGNAGQGNSTSIAATPGPITDAGTLCNSTLHLLCVRQ